MQIKPKFPRFCGSVRYRNAGRLRSPRHAKKTASISGNGSKTFCLVWIPLRRDRLICWSPGRNNVVNELGLVLWRGNVVGRSSSSDGIHFVAIFPFEKISPRSTITMELAGRLLMKRGMPSGGHHSPTAFIFLVNSHSKKSLFLLTMGLAGRIQWVHVWTYSSLAISLCFFMTPSYVNKQFCLLFFIMKRKPSVFPVYRGNFKSF